jgi:hypothetical protein
MGDNKKALGRYEKKRLVEIHNKKSDNIDTASTLNNIGNVHDNMGNYKLALENYNKCLEIQ